MFRRSARPHPDWFRHRRVSMPPDVHHARRSDSPGVPSPCAGRWLRIDAAHAAMSRDGGAPAMLQHTNCAGHPSMCISETTRSSSVLFREACEYDGFQQGSCIDRARRAWRLRIRNGWHGRRHGNIGRSGCLRCFDRAGCFSRFVRSIRPLYTGRLVAFQYIVPQQGGESSHQQIEHIPAVGARSRAYRSGHHTDQPSLARKHGHGHVHRHALGIRPQHDRSTRVPTHASRSARRNRTRRSPAAYGVRSCSPAT